MVKIRKIFRKRGDRDTATAMVRKENLKIESK